MHAYSVIYLFSTLQCVTLNNIANYPLHAHLHLFQIEARDY